MELQRPLGTITPTLEADVLHVLARADGAFTGRQVARLIPGHSAKGVSLALGRLVEQGVVSVAPAGPANLYQLNRDHLAAPHILALARLSEELAARVRELAESWEAPAEVVVLFGSAARGNMRPDSDIDLFVVGKTVGSAAWEAQMQDLAQRVRAWTGNDCRIMEMTAPQVSAGLASDPVLSSIEREGLTVFGPPGYLRRMRAGSKAS